MNKLLLGIAIGAVLSAIATIAIFKKPADGPTAADPPQVSTPADAAPPTDSSQSAEPAPAPMPQPWDNDDGDSNNYVVYEGHNTVILGRQNGDAPELVIVTARDEHIIGMVRPAWPVEYELQPVDGGGELLVLPFWTGGGTGVASYSALVIHFPEYGEPAIAQIWHEGYCQQGLAPSVIHCVENKGYDIQGNSLITSFTYFVDHEGAGEVYTFTDSVQLVHGSFITHACQEMMDFAFGQTPEADAPPEPEQRAAHNRELLAVTNDRTRWVSIVINHEDGEQTTLHEFNAQQNVFDLAASPDGRFGYVWHNEYNPRLLSIFDLDRREKLVTFAPGVGGTLRWTPANTICHNYGLGTNTFGYNIYSVQGETIAQGSGTGGDFSPDARYMLVFPTLIAADHPTTLIDTATGTVMREFSHDAQGNRIQVIDDLEWSDNQLTIQYLHSYDANSDDWPSGTMSIPLPPATD